MTADDMSFIPLRRSAEFPVAGRPFLAFATRDDDEIADLQSRAVELAGAKVELRGLGPAPQNKKDWMATSLS